MCVSAIAFNGKLIFLHTAVLPLQLAISRTNQLLDTRLVRGRVYSTTMTRDRSFYLQIWQCLVIQKCYHSSGLYRDLPWVLG